MSANGCAAIASPTRTVAVLLARLALLSSGCSTLVASHGVRLTDLKTRTMVHERLGEPTEVQAIHGQSREVYSTRPKVVEEGWVLGSGKAGYHSLKGQRVEFTADAVTQVTDNGLYPMPRSGGGHSFVERSPGKPDAGEPGLLVSPKR